MTGLAPKVFFSEFRVPKTGSSDTECEDAIEVRPGVAPDDDIDGVLAAAVADGASESMLASRWAGSLAKVAVEIGYLYPETFGDSHLLSAELVHRAVEPWDEGVKEYRARRQADGRPVQWYEEPGLEKGAYATLLAVHLERVPPEVPGNGEQEPSGPAWTCTAVALGDSCLFHISGDDVTPFPLQTSADFGLTPQLLGSRNHDVDLIAARLSYVRRGVRDGDELLLATDALAAWFLRGCEERSRPWRELGDVTAAGKAAFDGWVHEQREKRLMRNDDVALVRIQVRDEGPGDADGRDAG